MRWIQDPIRFQHAYLRFPLEFVTPITLVL